MRLTITDTTGRVWRWNCGWSPASLKPWEPPYALGHHQFNRLIGAEGDNTPARRHRRDRAERRGPRPNTHDWRSMRGLLMYHSWDGGIHGYGNVTVHQTDGIHAIVTDVDGIRLDVMLDHLSVIKPVAVASVNGDKRPRKKMSEREKLARRELRTCGIKKPSKTQLA